MALDQAIATRTTALRIESLLSARLFVNPQLADDRVYFVSDLAGRLSLYAMDAAGSVPEPLLPPGIALQNPELVGGLPYFVLPDHGRIVVMIDDNGDEYYEPLVIPLEGGFPEPLNHEAFGGRRSHLLDVDPKAGVGYFVVESRDEAVNTGLRADLATGDVETLGESMYGAYPLAWTPDHTRAILGDGYTAGDVVVYERDPDSGERRMIWGTPIEERAEGEEHPLLGFQSAQFTASGRGLLIVTSLFEDAYGPGYIDLDRPGEVEPVTLAGAVHEGQGELEGFDRIEGDRLVARFNIDGAAWAYEGDFDEDARKVRLRRVLCGTGELEGGVLHGLFHDEKSDRFVLSFCTAKQPTQLYLLDRDGPPSARTRERPLGVDTEHLSAGEDASFVSHDGLRSSARLYLPSPRLGYEGPRPLVYYVHGGPQGQERPNFAWFSMPLIQALTLEGFAVFVPNVRGSTGYGQDYMKRVDRDWGGQDRLDHVWAMTEILPQDERIDTTRAGVVGRSYGGYMTLTLAGRHPELWSAAVDMFGPYDLFTFVERIPPTWKPYFELALGHPERDRDFIEERSPRSYTSNIACPLLVIQGRNDPRVVEQESHDLVEALRAEGKDVDYLVFEDEGHDVLKLPNKIRCYETIVQFFGARLAP
ncbi:MAG TPA: alpha/beta fold hydrolase [Gaiellaceae bacterium]|jgi:dienelactone hydrolase|nr:alpha/beta fold hydrolase [Gaiellaceae bacterium]